MADDCGISTALAQHPKTIKLKRRLGFPGCWSLLCLFLWTAANRSDGNLHGLTDEDLEIAADWTGDAGVFVRTLTEVRFLDGTTGQFQIHDWNEHNPWAANRGRRIQAAKIAASVRWDRKVQGVENGAENANRMRDASAPHETAMPTTQTPPNPNTTQPDPTQHHRTEKSKPCSGAGAPPLPAWIPSDAWSGFVEMRKKIRAPLTNRAIDITVRKLSSFKDAGEDVGAILDQSTQHDWKGVFSLKGSRNGNGTTNRAEQRLNDNLAACAAVKRDFGLVS